MKMSKAFFLILISGFLLSMKISSTTLNDITSNSKKLKTISLSFLPLFKNENLDFKDKIYENENSQKFSIETLKVYISKIKFLNKNNEVFVETNSFHLLDIDKTESMLIKIQIPATLQYDEIQFGIGVDSVSNVGPMIGDLDPTKGMYWTWKAGYINFKLEGYRDGINSRKQEFQFHLGGYMPGENCFQETHFALSQKNKSSLKIGIDIFDFMQQIDLNKQNHIMSPGEEAVSLSNQLLKSFKLIKE